MAADILVYSGYAFERLERPLAVLEGLIDALITDPFVLDAPQTLPIRGSDNQRLHRLTALGRSRFADYDEPGLEGGAFDVMFDDDGTVWLAGIPRRGDFERLRAQLGRLGHHVMTTEDASPRRGTGEVMSEKICPDCGQRRPQNEIFCLTMRDGRECGWNLTDVPIDVPQPPVPEGPPAGGSVCMNGHTLNPGDLSLRHLRCGCPRSEEVDTGQPPRARANQCEATVRRRAGKSCPGSRVEVRPSASGWRGRRGERNSHPVPGRAAGRSGRRCRGRCACASSCRQGRWRAASMKAAVSRSWNWPTETIARACGDCG